jgi:hypothetical protein
MPLGPVLGRRVPTRLGPAWFDAELSDGDLDTIVDYFTRPDAHLDTLIDRSRMPPPEKLRERYAAWRWAGDPDQMSSVFALRLDGRFVGFTNLLRRTPEENYSHWHIVDESCRAGGLSTAIYPTRIDLYFDLFPIARLVHQTRVTNTGVNRMLDKFVPVARIEHVDKPDGLSKPGEFVTRHVTRDVIPRIRALGEKLAASR